MRKTLLLAALAGCTNLPTAPYPKLAGLTFEPSAAVWDPAAERLLVLSDKDQILYRYGLKDGVLALPEGEIHAPLLLPDNAPAQKFEALTRLPDGRFLAATYFGRATAPWRRLVRFAFQKEGPIEGEIVPVDEEGLQREIGEAWFWIEGLAVDEKHVYFGVRHVGPDYDRRSDVILIARCPFDGTRVAAPDSVVRLDGKDEGLSSLERDPRDGSFWILTSRENAAGNSGRLYRIPADRLTSSRHVPLGAPVREFRAKPEGLALLPSGTLLVVFDDDRDYNRRFAGYEQFEAFYLLVETPR